MRIRFFRPTDEVETARHLELQRRIDTFWRTLEEATRDERLRALPDPALLALAALDDRLVVELLREPGSLPQLVITAGGRADAAALADEIVGRAPRLDGVHVARYRPRRTVESVLDEVRALYGVDLSAAEARAGFARGHLLEVVVYSHEFSDGADERALDAANLAVMGLLGEACFDDWVGAVDVAPMPRPGGLKVIGGRGAEARYPLAELPVAVDRAVEGARAELSDAPYHAYCERASWTMLEVEANQASDYAAQDDLVHCVTMLPEMVKCFLSGARFSSTRFSRQGECFVYLKVDGAELDLEGRHALRLELEDRLNYGLVPGRVGCVVAAGLGLRYVYLTLALQNLEAGLDLTRRAACAAGVGERSWVLFCDSAWSGEWLGVFDTAPPPMM